MERVHPWLLRGTQTEREAFKGAWDGLQFIEVETSRSYIYVGGTWHRCLDVSGDVVSGNLRIDGRLGVGTEPADWVLGRFVASRVDPTMTTYGITGVNKINLTADSNLMHYGIYGGARLESGNKIGKLIGFQGQAAVTGSGTVTTAHAVSGQISVNASGNFSEAASLHGYCSFFAPGSVTAWKGLLISTPSLYSGCSLERVYGIYLENQDKASVENWAIYSLGGKSAHVGKFRFGASTAPTYTVDVTGDINVNGGVYRKAGVAGVSGTFTSADGKTITVSGGIVTGIA